MSQSKPTIVWFRSDLRLRDNPALSAALARGGPVLPVFIWAPDEEAPWQPGAARQWWLHQSLAALHKSLARHHSRLILRTGPTLQTLQDLVQTTGADTVMWNRRYEPAVIKRDRIIKQSLKADGLSVQSFNSHLLFEPWEIATKDGSPYKVFTPFWKACSTLPQPQPLTDAHDDAWPAPKSWPASLELDQLQLLPKIKWYSDMADFWQPGEAGATKLLDRFLDDGVRAYKDQRDLPHIDGTSRLSPHLAHGEISPRQICHAVRRFMADGRRNLTPAQKQQCHAYIREIGWREFAYHVLYHFPHTPESPLQDKYQHFPWRRDADQQRAWERGRTGYPFIDAGMRQLWQLGWMHNRVRMVVASFLMKDLMISWQTGARWFWDTLVDADLANNTLGWQWAGGCGADAAPYFRIFNPILQSKKFDPQGQYIHRFVEELQSLPSPAIHTPWEHPSATASISYPAPLIDHSQARYRALDALDTLKAKSHRS